MASEDSNKLEIEVLKREFADFKQEVNKNIYSNLIVFNKKVLFRNLSVKTLRNELEYDLVPTYIEVAEGLASGLTGATWTDWDLSSSIPAGALRADISMVNRVDAEYLSGVRKNGSSQDRFIYISNDSQVIMTVNLDDDRIIERYSTNANVTFAVRGYWI